MGIDAARRQDEREVWAARMGGDVRIVERAGRYIVQSRRVDLASLSPEELRRMGQAAVAATAPRGYPPGPRETKPRRPAETKGAG